MVGIDLAIGSASIRAALRLDRKVRRGLAALGVGLAVLLSSSVDAREPAPVTLTEVASSVRSQRVGNLVEVLRTEAESELVSIDWGKRKPKRRVSLSASLTRLDSTQTQKTLQATATVSATLRDARTGALLAILEGRAQAEDRPSAAAAAERDALKAAVRQAVGSIPEALRRMQ